MCLDQTTYSSIAMHISYRVHAQPGVGRACRWRQRRALCNEAVGRRPGRARSTSMRGQLRVPSDRSRRMMILFFKQPCIAYSTDSIKLRSPLPELHVRSIKQMSFALPCTGGALECVSCTTVLIFTTTISVACWGYHRFGVSTAMGVLAIGRNRQSTLTGRGLLACYGHTNAKGY